MPRPLAPALLLLCLLHGTVFGAAPANVTVSNIGAQTASNSTFYSSTQLYVRWTLPTNESIDHIVVTATESIQNTSVAMSAPANVTGLTLNGLKAATTYSVTVKSCANSACSSASTSAAATGRTSEEYWQLQGSGNGYANITKIVAEGSVLSWVMKMGSEAGANAGSYQYYYKTNSSGREGIGIATTSADATNPSSPVIPFTPITTAGLRSACSSAPGTDTSSCPATGAYEIAAIQVIPMKDGTVRAFFEAGDVKKNKSTRIYSLNSKDGLIGQDFHPGSSQAYCGGMGSSDYSTGGSCEPTVQVDIGALGSTTNPLLNARQFKIGYDWNADWRWDGASGTFMVITGEDTCNKYTSGLFYGTLSGSTWSVQKDSSNCAKPLVPLAHGPVLVPLGGVAFKLYYEDASNGQSGKPLRLMYSDGVLNGDTTKVEFEDWESNTSARQVNFLWPDGSLLDTQDESGLGDHMVLTPSGKLDKQFMFLNLGGMDNSKWNKGSAGLGMAVLLNASTHTIGPISLSPTTLATGSTATLSATATSGLTVSFSSTTPGVCTVSGSTVTGVAAGTCTIAANQAGNSNYSAALQTTQDITVTVPAVSSPVCTLSASPDVVTAGNTSTLTATCNPTASSYTWTGGTCAGTAGATCTVTPMATTTYTVAGTNSGGTGAAASATVTVTPCSYTLGTTSSSVVATASTGSISVTASCAWTASSNASWISIASGASGSGNGTVAYAIAANTDTSSRTGTLTIAGQTFTVTQAAATVAAPVCTLSANPGAITVGGSSTLTATCNPAATSYIWTGGSCAGTSASSCTASPTATTTYTVTGVNTGGTSQAASATVTVTVTTNATSYTVPGTLGNDVFVLTAANSYYGGGGDDTYIISPNTLRGDVTARIIDSEGDNRIQLVDGMTVTASSFYTDAAQLTLSSGAKVQILGASKFKFQVGANALSGDTATVLTYSEFVTSLGASLSSGTLPAAGTAGYVVPTVFTQAAAPVPAVAGSSYTVPGTLGDDVLVPSGGNNYLGGGGSDTYIISTYTLSGTVTAKITDTEGGNVIQLVKGLTIASSTFYNNAVQLTLSNGATVQILGASGFTYQLGANAPAGETASSLSYAQFAAALGASVPTGTSLVSGSANFVVPSP